MNPVESVLNPGTAVLDPSLGQVRGVEPALGQVMCMEPSSVYWNLVICIESKVICIESKSGVLKPQSFVLEPSQVY
jgi:hypothetical protein